MPLRPFFAGSIVDGSRLPVLSIAGAASAPLGMTTGARTASRRGGWR